MAINPPVSAKPSAKRVAATVFVSVAKPVRKFAVDHHRTNTGKAILTPHFSIHQAQIRLPAEYATRKEDTMNA
jgi:hypothetical protein